MNDSPIRLPDAHEIELKRASLLAYVKQTASSALAVFIRAFSGRSLRAGVNAHCLECLGLSRDEVRNCSAPACTLWPYRPYQRKRGK